MSRRAAGPVTSVLVALSAAALILSAGPARAQALPANPPLPPVVGTNAAPSQAAPPPESGEALPPYEPQIERLAERLGALTYMRNLCGKGDAAEWRNRMNALLDAEARSAARRDRLAGAYNRGFWGYQATYKACTPSAELVISRFLSESEQLARDLSARYGAT